MMCLRAGNKQAIVAMTNYDPLRHYNMYGAIVKYERALSARNF